MTRRFRQPNGDRKHHINKKRKQSYIKHRTFSRSSRRSALIAKANKFIMNLSSYHLSDDESLALGKSLNFIPTPNKPNKQVLLTAAKTLTRSMRIRYIATQKRWKSRHKFRNPSTWNPGPTFSNALEDYLEAIKVELNNIPIKTVPHNINKAELAAIKSLKNNPNIVLKKYDKGRGICVMSTKDYIAEGYRQLYNPKSYLELDYDMTTDTAKMISDVVSEMYLSKEIDKALTSYLDPNDSLEKNTPVFFMLPKIHKQPPAGSKFIGRPVISHCGCPLNRISEFLDKYLLPQVQISPLYLKDTADTIRKVEKLKLPNNIILASIDIKSMFTSVPQNEAFEVAMETLANLDANSYDPPIPKLKYMSKLLKLVLYRNAFVFNDKHFLQISGTPMGLKSSPSISCLVVNKLIQQIQNMEPRIKTLYLYMDDSLLAWEGTMIELDQFIKDINELHDNIKFTYEASHTEIQFLDLTIYKGERFKSSNILDIKCFTKPTETWCYLDRASCHSPNVFQGFIKGEFIRYIRNSSNQKSYEEKKSVFSKKLLDRGYTTVEITKATKEVVFSNRDGYIAEKLHDDTIPLVFKIQYYPHISSKHIKEALSKHWDIISDNPTIKHIFPKIPIIAYSRAKNLKDNLVRAKLTTSENQEPENIYKIPRPGSPTLLMLQDLESESHGFNDFYS